MKRTTHKSIELPKDYAGLVRHWPPCAPQDEVAYDNLLELIDQLDSIPKPTKDQERYLNTISILLEDYERQHYADDFGELPPLDVLKYLLDGNGMNASDLGTLLGDRALGSRILRGERELSKAHARTLAKRFKVTLDLFIGYN